MNLCANTEALKQHLNEQDQLESAAFIFDTMETIHIQRDRVMAFAAALTSSTTADIWDNGRRWTFEDVITELINHKLFAQALFANIQGNPLPLRDLTRRTAQSLACVVLGIEADSIGLAK